MILRSALMATLACVVPTGTSIAQVPQLATDALLTKLRSSNPIERAASFQTLSSRPHAFEGPRMSKALLEALERENDLIYSVLRESKGQMGVSGKYGEGYSEYYASLLGACDQYCDKRSDRTLEALANSAYSSSSSFAVRLSQQYGARTAPFFLKLALTDLPNRRRDAVLMLTQIWRLDSSLAPNLRESIHLAVRTRTGDERPYVRSAAARALGDLGSLSDIATLERLSTDADSSVRVEAFRAIRRIRR